MCVEITSCPLPQHVRVVIKFDSWYCARMEKQKTKWEKEIGYREKVYYCRKGSIRDLGKAI